MARGAVVESAVPTARLGLARRADARSGDAPIHHDCWTDSRGNVLETRKGDLRSWRVAEPVHGSALLGAVNAQLQVGQHDEAAGPSIGVLALEGLHDPSHQGQATRACQAHQHEARVGAGPKSAQVGKVQVLGDSYATFGSGGIGQSSPADAAAKAITARRSSTVMLG
jgi:hypothetical protein